jgi:hypothetical protein
MKHLPKERRAMDDANLLDMIAVLEEERRFNEAAALLCTNAAQRNEFARRARAGATAIRTIRHEMARTRSGHSRRRRSRRIDTYIDRLIDTQLETGHAASERLNTQPLW